MKQSILIVILAVIGALVVIHFAADRTYKLQAFEVSVDVDLASYPRTTISFPPAGKITADTHLTPVNLILTLESIHQQELADIISKAETKADLYSLLHERTSKVLELFLLRIVLLGGLGGIFGAAVIKSDFKCLVLGITVASLVVVVFICLTYYSYDLDSFSDPKFSGMLEAAPWMVSVIEEGLTDIEKLGIEMEEIASNMAELFNKLDSFQSLSRLTGDLKVLHISDIHNNPAAIKFISQIAESFKVDLIIDTGDITDYGTLLEGELLTEIKRLNIPYIFTAGNHDSPAIIQKLDSFSNVTVLEEKIISIMGLTIAGVSDPAVETNGIAPLNSEEMQESSKRLTKLITSSKGQVDILAVHQYELGQPLVGKIPVLLHGHTHKFELSRRSGTIVINAGTTGAAGVRGFKNGTELPNSVALLHYKKNESKLKLEIVDIIKFYSRRSGFTLERKLVNK